MDSKGYNSYCTHCARLNILIIMVASLSTIGSSVPFVRPPQQPTTSLRKLEQQYGSDHADMEALLQFKAHVTNDARGALKEWDAGNNGNLCSWNGVTCSPTKRVIRLELRSTGLEGNFALSSLVQLDMLEVLDLSGNFLRGNLTAELNEVLAKRSTCSNLQVLVLSHNYIEGSFPASLLSSCGSIQQLDFSYNNLSGSLPQNMFLQCGSLSDLDLSHNRITGTLPDGIGQCSSLQRLVLSFNTLIGKLPMDLLSNCSEQFCTTSHEAAPKPTLKLLDLSSNNLTGPVSDMIFSQCESLVTLDLSSNSFDGEIPPSLQGCNALQSLNLSGNNLGSRLPEALSSLSSIKLLDISNNKIVGPIPTKLGSICPTLVYLDLSSNNISGTLPSSFGSCDSLQYLNLAKNNLSGSFPGEVLSQFKGLEALLLAFNQFTGPFPLELANCRSLKVLELGSNKLSGNIPSTGFCSPSFGLERLSVPNNGFYGEVPASLANCSHLRMLDLSFNHLQGPIPPALGSLSNLDTLFIWYNSLTGEIPKELGRLSNLKNLVLNNNQLSGPIPVELSNCTAIEWLYLSNNQLTGSIPAFLGRLQQLTLLEMANNSFTGNIPSELANVSKFLWVDLNSNYLTGPIPPGLGRHISGPSGPLTGTTYTFLRYLDNGCRGLGTLLEFSGITQDALSSTPFKTLCTSRTYMDDSLNHDSDYSSIHYLDLSYNNLEGSIPEEMGYLGALLMLSLAHNKLVGLIPSSFSHLRSLGVLDLSYNALEGGLGPLANCSFLVQINVSFNHLSGPIPSTGQLSTALPTSYANNSGLCGEPLLVTCSSLESNISGNCDHGGSCGGRKSGLSVLPWANSIVLGILISVAFMCMLIVWGIMMRAKGKQKDTDNMLGNLQLGSCHGNSSWNLGGEKEPLSINVATFERPLRKLTFAQLIEATNGFSQESLIGIGGFGEVYKAELKDGSTVAIKKLLQFSYQGDREFTAEMETLGKIKHRHLVPLLGYCKVGEERLLVYEYMAEGSLDDMLHGETGRRDRLTWELRKQIARGAAKGLSFLHHNCIPHIIHRDMKSSNVLLDRNLEARLSDFGMARLISALDTHLSVSTLAGTPGYVPPEYYQSFRCTTKGDIYSFGVILLELLTGKRPTDKEAFEDNNLVGWVRQHVSDKRSLQVLDPSLAAPIQQGSSSCPVQLEMLQYLRIACECVEELPSRRPTMLEVVSMFKELQMNEGGD